MTERGRAPAARAAPASSQIGPSRLHWDGEALAHRHRRGRACRCRGACAARVRLHPQGLCGFSAALDAAGRHRWGPIAPCARVEVELRASPALRWSGHAYLDSNEGDEPIDRAFTDWDWSRAPAARRQHRGDLRRAAGQKRGRRPRHRAALRRRRPRRALRARRRGRRCRAPPGASSRTMRSDAGVPPRVLQTLEDTPFYVRSVLRAGAARRARDRRCTRRWTCRAWCRRRCRRCCRCACRGGPERAKPADISALLKFPPCLPSTDICRTFQAGKQM